MLTILPLFCLAITLNTGLVTLNAELKLVSITACQCSSLMRMNRSSRVIPALLTRMSMRPHFSTTVLTIVSIVSVTVTLHGTDKVCPPSRPSSSAVVLHNSSLMSVITIFAPSRIRAAAIALPIPRPEPVTTATLSANFDILYTDLLFHHRAFTDVFFIDVFL